MKCDKLKAEPMIINDDYTALYYPKDPVDAAIDELKTENETLMQQNRELCRALQVMYTKEEYDKQKAENAELKRNLEDTKATAYAESVDAGMENRKLKRALWMARAYRAEARKNYWYARSVHEGDERLWSIDGSAVKYIGCIKRTNFDWLKTWSEVEIKCRAKADEYK